MTLLTLLAALALDYYRPLSRPSAVDAWLAAQASWLRERFDSGSARHGWLAWGVGALLPAAAVGMLTGMLGFVSPPLSVVLACGVLYFAMAYRQTTLTAADMVGALGVLDLDRARRFCGNWCADLPAEADVEAMARRAIDQVFRDSQERLFGIIFWFAWLNLFGALFYALTRFFAEHWRNDVAFGGPARQVLHWLDWLPAHGLAFSFAIVGNFEQALAGWRALPAQAGNHAVVKAAGAGALGVRLSAPLDILAPGDPAANWDAPSPEYIDGALNLVWRALLLWLGVLAMVWLVGW
jgi:adenosylcobinamide-phosphate synthase